MKSVSTRWVPEVREKGPADALLVLVGIAGATADDDNCADPYSGEDDTNDNSAMEPVAHADGAAVAREVGAVRYLECSLYDVSSVNAVVHETIRVIRQARGATRCALQ